MSRNRKRQTGGVRPGPVIKALLLCLCIGLGGVGYVWQKNQIYKLGQSMRQNEKKYIRVQQENKSRMNHLTQFRSTVYLEERIKALKLGLEMPSPGRVITLPDLPMSIDDDAAAKRYVAAADEDEIEAARTQQRK